MKSHYISSKPKLIAKVESKENTILSIRLEKGNEGFYLEGSDDPSLLSWLSHYAEGKLRPLHFSQAPLSPFYRKIYQALLKVPFAKTLSYKALAEMTGHPNAHRALATALKKNPFPLLYPCHRIIKANQEIGEYQSGQAVKEILLDFERSKLPFIF